MFAPRWIVTPAATLIVAGACLLGGGNSAQAADRDFRGHDNGHNDRDRDRDNDRDRDHDRDNDRDRNHDRDRDHDRRGSFGLQIGIPGRIIVRDDCPPSGHFVERQVQVLVSPAHYEERRTPAVLETRYDYYRRPYTIEVAPASCVRVLVPAVYETRCERIWVADAPVRIERPGGFFLGIHF